MRGIHTAREMLSPAAGVDPVKTAQGVATSDPFVLLEQTRNALNAVANNQAAMAQVLSEMLEGYVERENKYANVIETYTFSHNPATNGGKTTLWFSKIIKGGFKGFSLSTLQTGAAAGADTRDTTIYLRFDDDMPVSGSYPMPSAYDLFVSMGGKLNKYQTVTHVNAVTFYCRTAFDGVMFLTAGDVDRLPGL